jgi:F-type H+-transporting ATPase subunit epsilon
MSQKQQLHVVIATPLGTVYDSEVNQLTVTTTDGELTILPNHIPLVTTLVIGKAMVKKGNDEIFHTIDGGVLEVRHDNKVVILSNRSEQSTSIDIKRAESAIKRAQEFMTQKHQEEDVDYANLERKIAKDLNRISVAQRGQRK